MMEVPEEYGGPGLALFQRAVVSEELSRTIALPARGEGITGPSVRPILFQLNGEMKEKYLMPVLRGEKKACFAQTEPDAGSDPGGMRTTAVKRRRPLRHQRRQALHHRRRQGGLPAAHGGDRPRQGLARRHLMLPRRHGHAGREARRAYQTMMGDRPWEIIFDNVRVPATNLVGGEGEGFKLGAEMARRGPHQAWRARARRRRALPGDGDRPTPSSASPSASRWRTGRRSSGCWPTCTSTCRRRGSWSTRPRRGSTQGEDAREDCYMCKYYADEMAFRAADDCMQIHGGIGLTTDLPIEKMWRQQRSYRITEGASEVMKMVIARHVLKTYG